MNDPNRRRGILLMIAGASVLLLTLLFFPLFLARSQTTTQANASTGRAGDALPPALTQAFPLAYHVAGPDALAAATSRALPDALALTPVGTATATADPNSATTPRLWVEIDQRSLRWSPFYATADLVATFYFADRADVPWPADAPMVFEGGAELRSSGSVTLSDTTWGVIGRPAYRAALGQALAEGIAAELARSLTPP